MRRRKFITLLGGAAAWPLAAGAQQADRMRRIGVLMAFEENDPKNIENLSCSGKAAVARKKLGITEIINILAVRAKYRGGTRKTVRDFLGEATSGYFYEFKAASACLLG